MKNASKLVTLVLFTTGIGCVCTCHAQPTLEWMKWIGKANYGGIATDGEGYVYLGGETDDILPASLGGTGRFFLAKYDADGALQWTKQPDDFTGVAVVSVDEAGDVYAVGNLPEWHSRIVRFAPDGTLLQQFDLNAGEYGATVDGLRNVYAMGRVEIDDISQESEPLLTKYDASGAMQWSRQFNPDGRPSYESAAGVTADGLGNVYVAIRNQALRLEEPWYRHDSVAKYDAGGALQWTKQLGSGERISITDIAADNSGNIFATGSTFGDTWEELTGGPDAYLVNLDTHGDVQWARHITSIVGDDEYAAALSTDGRGNVYVVGNVIVDGGGSPSQKEEIWVAKFDVEGTLHWHHQFSLGSQYPIQVLSAITADGLGNLYLSGYGHRVGWPFSDSDGFVAKFVDPQVIPEPASIWLLSLATLAIAGLHPRVLSRPDTSAREGRRS